MVKVKPLSVAFGVHMRNWASRRIVTGSVFGKICSCARDRRQYLSRGFSKNNVVASR